MNNKEKALYGCSAAAVIGGCGIIGTSAAVYMVGKEYLERNERNVAVNVVRMEATPTKESKPGAAAITETFKTPTPTFTAVIGKERFTVTPRPVEATPTPKKVDVTPVPAKTEAPKTSDAASEADMLRMIPRFPELVKDDPETKFVPNRVPMWFAAGDTDNPLNEMRNKVNAYSNSKGWGDITAKPGEWHYPLPINGKGETTSDTWAYAENIIKTDKLSVYMKPNVTGQVWFRLPQGETQGHMTVAYGVNQNFEADKTEGDPNKAPNVTVKCTNNPGQSVTVRVWDIYKDGRVFARNDGYIGLPKTDTDNIMVRLNRDAITMIDFAVVDQTGNQREGMLELGSDTWNGKFFNPNLNRSRVEDVAKQVR
ncbi:MAG: hypothetical protein PHQ59_05730 [Candidatus Daviesbacteria bacterium]|nr:hypothetical protein [Candidatus Daviesbacteria bacterium]